VGPPNQLPKLWSIQEFRKLCEMLQSSIAARALGAAANVAAMMIAKSAVFVLFIIVFSPLSLVVFQNPYMTSCHMNGVVLLALNGLVYHTTRADVNTKKHKNKIYFQVTIYESQNSNLHAIYDMNINK